MPDLFVNQPASTPNPVATTTVKPTPFSAVSFASQDPDESVLLLVRRHGITNLAWILTVILLGLLPIAGNLFFHDAMTSLLSFLPPRYVVIVTLFYYALVISYGFVSFLDWLYNLLIVTNKKIVRVTFSDIVYHQVTETKLESIRDVKFSQVGAIASLFDFGSLSILTDSKEENFDIANIPHPQAVANTIEDLTEAHHGS